MYTRHKICIEMEVKYFSVQRELKSTVRSSGLRNSSAIPDEDRQVLSLSGC